MVPRPDEDGFDAGHPENLHGMALARGRTMAFQKEADRFEW
jgi:hypothetical protein